MSDEPLDTFNRRITRDWWGECYSCKWWAGDRSQAALRGAGGTCGAVASPNFKQVTFPGGNCKEWDAFDVDAALEVMEPKV